MDIRSKQHQIEVIQNEKQKFERGYINIRANRKNVKLFHDQILYVESLADYVKIHVLEEKPIITKEKISGIEERLPDLFLRIHRSFLVNKDLVRSFNKEEVIVGDVSLPISRTYKKEALTHLEKSNR